MKLRQTTDKTPVRVSVKWGVSMEKGDVVDVTGIRADDYLRSGGFEEVKAKKKNKKEESHADSER